MGKERKLKIRDLTLRDGQQSLFATRMNQNQINRLLPLYREAGFYAMEVWGGAVPDSCMRYLTEDPWQRLEFLREGLGGASILTALSRGRNLFGYNPYPQEVIEGFNRNAIQSGIGIMRVFDALNDIDNMVSTIKVVKENGALADCCVCYTIDPTFSTRQIAATLIRGRKVPRKLFTTAYFVKKATRLQELGADMVTLKDMAGLVSPLMAAEITRELKKSLDIPVDFHTHCTPGYGLASVLMAIMNGADIVDTNMLNFSGGTAAPAYELIHLFCKKLGIATDINPQAVSRINSELKAIRTELREFDTCAELPIPFDLTSDKVPGNIDILFDKAIEAAGKMDENRLLACCQAIEQYFNLPKPDEKVRLAEIPGGMYSNMLAQLKQLGLDHLLPRVLERVPQVRLDAGCPPLVTPTSQIIGVQAVNCVLDENKGLPPYSSRSIQFTNLVKGVYGKTPVPINSDFREKICGHAQEITFDSAAYKREEKPISDKYPGVDLAETEKDMLLVELFPSVAKNYLKNRYEARLTRIRKEIEEAREQKIRMEKEAYEQLSSTEKHERLLQGLYNYPWASSDINDFDEYSGSEFNTF